MTNEEQLLLAKMENGELDGIVGDEREYRGYRSVYCGKYIRGGVAVMYRQGQSTRFFNGRENENTPGKREEERFDTPERKLQFLQRYGWLMDDPDVRAYSAKFKPSKRQ